MEHRARRHLESPGASTAFGVTDLSLKLLREIVPAEPSLSAKDGLPNFPHRGVEKLRASREDRVPIGPVREQGGNRVNRDV